MMTSEEGEAWRKKCLQHAREINSLRVRITELEEEVQDWHRDCNVRDARITELEAERDDYKSRWQSIKVNYDACHPLHLAEMDRADRSDARADRAEAALADAMAALRQWETWAVSGG